MAASRRPWARDIAGASAMIASRATAAARGMAMARSEIIAAPSRWTGTGGRSFSNDFGLGSENRQKFVEQRGLAIAVRRGLIGYELEQLARNLRQDLADLRSLCRLRD